MKKNRSILSLFSAVLLLLTPLTAQAVNTPDYSTRLYYFYQVGNQIPLSDFELGSDETIRDKDGNGIGFSWIIKRGKVINLELDFGTSQTVYEGQVEDGVSITFVPQSGEGFDTLSSSTNVTYDFDVTFQNPYVGFNIVFPHFVIGGGRIFQTVTGDVKLSSKGFEELVTAEYETGTQLYYHLGFFLWLDDLFFGASFRAFEAPELKVKTCNEKALGTLACDRIRGASGNRNLRSNSFGEGLLQFGMVF